MRRSGLEAYWPEAWVEQCGRIGGRGPEEEGVGLSRPLNVLARDIP